jgi:hypothetical protein
MNKNEGRKEGREESTKIFSYLLSFCISHQSLAPPSLWVVLAEYVCHVGVSESLSLLLLIREIHMAGTTYPTLPYLGTVVALWPNTYIYIHTYTYIIIIIKKVPKVLPKLTI